ncbi:LOW QUALITY PROTEIN: E3 ubiquitin-protein ligase RNF180 [Megalobrama amblycephala]|uniref:LOW QUALITY PROTEIN: E3 ubiquitin-protein ligase RNF180 n=1 Tax=Megalobrama amblycephala TaxID=75352 RepID=UPI002013EF96|nr:LOW QUALITY PROTEIN: E3 ubiquitin-protein ligase RNF180 [Megalobrama amblycephala]
MGSHGGEDLGRTAEALCLEVRPLQKAPLGVRLAHRKAFSLEYGHPSRGSLQGAILLTRILSSALPRLRSPHWTYAELHSQPAGLTSQCQRTTPPAQPPYSRAMMLSRRSDIESVRLDIIRGSREDQEAGGSFNHRAPLMSLSSSEEEQEFGEQAGRAPAGLSVTSSLLTPTPTGERRLSKRERKRLKSLRRRQRRRERCRQSQQQENVQSSTGNPSSSSEDEELPSRDREGYICAVCLDVYFSPYMCHPCSHVFCEPCLRTLAKNCPTNTPCPLCRTTITHVFFQKELNHTARTFFPKEYLSRKQNFQKASCAKWPLPSCRKLFRIFGGFQRQASPIGRRQFPHGGYRLDSFNFEDDSHGWRFDMDMVIIYIYSVNWVIGFIIFCFFCYFFFLSF